MEGTPQEREGGEEEGMQLSSNGRAKDMLDVLFPSVGVMEGEETPDLPNQFDGFSGDSQPTATTNGGSGDSVFMETDGNDLSQGGRRGSGHGKQTKGRKGSGVSKPKDPPPPPPPGHCWFQFNDTQVSSTVAKALDKMYQGKQSAYMLFYRRRSLPRPAEAQGNLLYGVPERFQVQVAMENAKLEEERQQYEIAVNTIRLNIHLSSQYTLSNGALHQSKDAMVTVVSVDRRKTIRDLKTTISEAVPEAVGSNVVISIAKTLPAGMHLYNSLSDNEETTVQDCDILDNSNLFIWDGKQVGGELIQTGKEKEPILLNVTHPILDSEGEETEGVMEIGRPKNSTLGELRALLASVLNTTPQQLTLSQVKVSERNRTSCVVVFTSSKDKCTLEQLKLTDGDQLAAEASIKKGVKTLAHAVADKQNNLLAIIVEDRCSPQLSDGFSYPVVPMEASKDTLLSAFKEAILSKINLPTVEGGCRLRLEDGPPLNEDQSLDQAGMTQGLRVILEPGQAPTSSQLALRCTVLTGSKEWEVIVDYNITVAECCSTMVQVAGLEGTHWHLRKTNWCGEAAEVLEDEANSLTKEHVKSGDLLLIEEGKLPPKGFIRISISLYTPSSPVYAPCYLSDPAQSRGILSWVMDCVRDVNGQGSTHNGETQTQTEVDTKEVPLHLRSPLQHYPPLPGYLTDLGTVEIHKDASVEELKALILTLPAMESVSIPTLNFLRVREVVEGQQLGKVFKQPQQTLRRQKLTTGSRVCVMILDFEESVPTSAVFLNIQARIPGQRKYGPPAEIVYDTTTSTKPSQLINLISVLVDIPKERLGVAKKKTQNFEWIRLQDTYSTEGAKKGRKRKGSGSVNLKNAPLNIKDGDYLGVKDLQYDPLDQDDFSTADDDQGKAILAAIQEEKRTKRKARNSEDVFASQRPRRAEVGIKIFVPDYKRTT